MVGGRARRRRADHDRRRRNLLESVSGTKSDAHVVDDGLTHRDLLDLDLALDHVDEHLGVRDDVVRDLGGAVVVGAPKALDLSGGLDLRRVRDQLGAQKLDRLLALCELAVGGDAERAKGIVGLDESLGRWGECLLEGVQRGVEAGLAFEHAQYAGGQSS